MNFKFLLRSGKNPKFIYFIKSYWDYSLPKQIFTAKLNSRLSEIEHRKDKEYILKRVEYYNKLKISTQLPDGCKSLKEHTLKNKKGTSVYFFDTYRYTKWFPQYLRWAHKPGDITTVPDIPTIVKSRPISDNNQNSVLLNLNRVRHFIFIKDTTPFEEKKNMIVFRGKVKNLPARTLFMEKYFGHPLCNAGDIKNNTLHPEWFTPKMTIYDHLKYKFIMAIEGNDVASNLKWIMSSNSIAVMPRPKFETWFMEGTLVPNYHYIEVKPDFSNVMEAIEPYIKHPEKAHEIITNAHTFISQFQDKKREDLISLKVLERYFLLTNPQNTK